MTWTNTNPFLPGSTIRADAMNSKLEGISSNLQEIDEERASRLFKFPAGFNKSNVLPAATPNSFLWINNDGNADIYPKASFDSEVALAVTSAQNASASAAAAFTSETNARQSEINAAASAEIAQEAAGSVAGAAFVAGPWNAGTGAFPTYPVDGSSIWYATTDGTGATAAIKTGDLIIYNIINPGWIHFVGHARVAALEALRLSEDNRIEAKADAALAIAAAGL